MTPKQIRIVSLCIFLCGIPAAIGDKLVAVPGLPPWVAQLWPFIFALAGIADKALHIYYDPALPKAVPADKVSEPANQPK